MRTRTEERLRNLLAEALERIYAQAENEIESASKLARVGDEFVPAEGTLDERVVVEVVPLIRLIQRIEYEGVRAPSEHPAWLIDIVQRRRRL